MGTQLLNMFSTPIGSRRDQQPAHLNMRNKLVIVMVGLPARGKSYVTKKLCRYLNWLHHETKIFNVGDRRRFVAGSAHHASASDAHTAIDTKFPDQSANFFDPNNREAGKLRERLALETLDDLLTYLMDNHGSVAIFDATNSTIERRELLVSQIRKKAGPDLSIMFLESQCFDETVGS
jgi:6-phosphofructo-2-kinase